MIGYCKDCKHWKSEDTAKQGTCQRIDCEDGCIYSKPLPDGEIAQVQASYDVTGAALETAPLFGCILFEEKGT